MRGACFAGAGNAKQPDILEAPPYARGLVQSRLCVAGRSIDGIGEEASMGIAKSIWSSVQGDPVFMRRVNGWLTMFWLAMIPVSLATGWVKSVTYVSALSLWALVSGHWSAWQAARVEVNQQEEDIAGQVVEQVGREDRRRAGLRRRDGWRRSIRACRRVRRLDMRAARIARVVAFLVALTLVLAACGGGGGGY